MKADDNDYTRDPDKCLDSLLQLRRCGRLLSLRVPPGVSGIVIAARVFARKGTEKDDRAKEIEDAERAKFEKDMADEIKIIRESAYARIRKHLIKNTTTA